MNTLAQESGVSTKQAFAVIIASVALVAGLLGAGLFKVTHNDPCEQAFRMADRALSLSGDVMKASSRSTIAIRNEDADGARAASRDIDKAVAALEQMQPDYEKAEAACLKK